MTGRGKAAVVAILVAVAAAAFAVLAAPAATAADDPTEGAGAEIATVYDTPSDESAETATVAPANSGPLYSLPLEYEQEIVCDRSNRAYILVTRGTSFSIVPYLDENGEQVVIPQA